MASFLAWIAERRIEEALAEGELTGLAGEGRPLPERDPDPFGDPLYRAAVEAMRDAGVVPEEITLGRRVDEARRQLREIHDPEERRAKLAELTDLDLRRTMLRERRLRGG